MSWGFTKFTAGIDLRSEIDGLFNGTQDIVPLGQWIIYRRFDLNTKSIYYNEETHEGVGGPKYEYTDELIKTYKWNIWQNDPFNETQSAAGLLDVPLVIFFIEHDVRPKEQDEIFEIDWEDNTVIPTLESLTKPYLTRFNIKNIKTYRFDRARTEFYQCISVQENINY